MVRLIFTAVFLIVSLLSANIKNASAQTCNSYGGTCRPATLCGSGVGRIDNRATDCGTNFCCVPTPAVGVSCSSLGNTCRSACQSGEIVRSGTFYDCTGGNNLCCERTGPVVNPNPSTPATTAQTQTCSYYGGTCMPAQSCSTNNIRGATSDCPSPATCCLPTQSGTCRGVCVPRGSCGGGNIETVTLDCGPSLAGICCTPTTTTSPQSAGSTAQQASTFPNPIGANNATEFLQNILNSLRGIVVIISIIFIIIGGIMYMTAAGSEKMIDKAKATITGAVVGIAIVIAAPSFLLQILEILEATAASGQTSSALTIRQIAENVLRFLLSITGIIAIISLLIGGGMYLTAYGDENRIEKGKQIIKYSIIGILVASAALVIVRQVAALIGG